ncbi:MAG: aspartate kinase, partial [Aquificae bacterium]|nr:aspartate kinase [Aquificota bacterium]
MNILVQKFGGTSVADLEKIELCARRVIEAKEKGYAPVVVSSAMAGETDALIELAKKVHPRPPEREMDLLLTTGEQKAIALFAMTLNKLGHPAVSLCGWQVPIITDGV